MSNPIDPAALAEATDALAKQAAADLVTSSAKEAADILAAQNADAIAFQNQKALDQAQLDAANAKYADLLAKYNADEAILHPKPSRASFGVAVVGSTIAAFQSVVAFFKTQPLQGARVYYQPGVLPTTLAGAVQNALDSNPKLQYLCVSYKPDPANAAAGQYDAWAKAIGAAFKAVTDKGIEVLFCLQHEMDNPSKDMDPVAYNAMWDRIIPLVKGANPKIKAAWIPMGFQVLQQGNPYPYRPKAANIDVLMPDIYSYGATVKNICDPVFALLDSWYPNKSHGLGEFGIQTKTGVDRGQWVLDGLNNAGLTYALYFDLQNGADAPDWSLTNAELTKIANGLS